MGQEKTRPGLAREYGGGSSFGLKYGEVPSVKAKQMTDESKSLISQQSRKAKNWR